MCLLHFGQKNLTNGNVNLMCNHEVDITRVEMSVVRKNMTSWKAETKHCDSHLYATHSPIAKLHSLALSPIKSA